MIVKITEITKSDSGTKYQWLGGDYRGSRTGVASKITGDGVARSSTEDGKVKAGTMGWMNEEDPDSIYIPLSWP
jgi:hypothetical protein